jgi:hypothetical protein
MLILLKLNLVVFMTTTFFSLAITRINAKQWHIVQ